MTNPKPPLQPGDRVRCYADYLSVNGSDGTVKEYSDRGSVQVEMDNKSLGVGVFHPKQCRRIKKKQPEVKPERVERWISAIAAHDSIVTHRSPVGIAEPIHLQEVKPGEFITSKEKLYAAWGSVKGRPDLYKYPEMQFKVLCKALGLEETK